MIKKGFLMNKLLRNQNVLIDLMFAGYNIPTKACGVCGKKVTSTRDIVSVNECGVCIDCLNKDANYQEVEDAKSE